MFPDCHSDLKKVSTVFIAFFFISGIYANTVDVCPSCPITQIAQGISIANAGDTVRIGFGTYQEYNLHITKKLVVIGIDMPVVDGGNQGEIFTIESDNVTLMGLYIRNVGISFTTDYAAIRVVNSKYFAILNNKLDELFFGIYLEKSGHGMVKGNVINGDAKDEYNSGNGIHLWYSHNVRVENNDVNNVRDGIYLEFSDTITIIGNVSKNNLRYGLHFMFSDDDVYTGNTFERNGAGVAVMFSRRIIMNKNTFINNWGSSSYGLLLKEISDADITDNRFENNTIAVNIEGSNRINYMRNTFKGNGWALKILGACYDNVFEGNDFLYNSFDVSLSAKLNNNVFKENYWSDYSGYDLDRNGLGDVPYRPVKLFSYIVNRTPETIVLLRSLFMDIIDFSERVSPVFTPDNLIDASPRMKPML